MGKNKHPDKPAHPPYQINFIKHLIVNASELCIDL